MPLPITISRYGTRYWSVHLGQELIAVTLYKKGAKRVAELLSGPPPAARSLSLSLEFPFPRITKARP